MPHTDFTAMLNEVDDSMKRLLESKVKDRWEIAPMRLQIVAMRIENEKLLAMHEQNKQLKRIAEYLEPEQKPYIPFER